MHARGRKACCGTNFTEVDPSWNPWWPDIGSWDIADGKVAAKADPGYAGFMMYEGDFFPAADACVDITMPDVRDPTYVWAGLNFYDATCANYIVLSRLTDKRA